MLLATAAAQLARTKESLDQRASAVTSAARPAEDESVSPQAGQVPPDPARLALEEQLVRERQALRADRAALEAVARRLLRKRGGALAGASLAGLLTLWVALAAGSWFVAGRFAPAMFAASARLGIEDAGGELDDEQRRAWGKFIEQLPGDPQFIELAADRFKQRLIPSLATPGLLAQRLERDLSLDPAGTGEVMLTLVGHGASRTERELQTIVSAAVTRANDTRAFRDDQAATLVLASAKTDPEPIEDPRLALFGAILGGATALLLLGGAACWRGFTRRADAQARAIAHVRADSDIG